MTETKTQATKETKNDPQHGFEMLCGDVNFVEHDGTFLFNVSGRIGDNDLDCDSHVVLEFLNMEGHLGDEATDELLVTSYIVSPQFTGIDNIEKAMESCGCHEELEQEELDALSDEERTTYDLGLKREIIYACKSYGFASCGSFSESYSVEAIDNDDDKLEAIFKDAARSAMVDMGLTGFVLDKRQNAIGSTGWDFLKGQLGMSWG